MADRDLYVRNNVSKRYSLIVIVNYILVLSGTKWLLVQNVNTIFGLEK